ncbi:uncharacterized protein LOC143623703 isoform X2 [Bidens hawaiensis]|uniref:uncharacterized protein LOC143623703 isoform X2 n=1 Tax=Bidens hawaiensis TaxID=980011 RepID=UPI00404A2F66
MGAFTFKKAPETFWASVISEFRKYYSYHHGVSDTDGDAVVKEHAARTMTQTLYEERDRAMIRAEQHNTSLEEERPAYFDKDEWRSFCSHWCKASFKEKCAIYAKNRRKLQVVHTTGAKPFNKFKQVLEQKYNEPPTAVQFGKKHTRRKTQMTGHLKRLGRLGSGCERC